MSVTFYLSTVTVTITRADSGEITITIEPP